MTSSLISILISVGSARGAAAGDMAPYGLDASITGAAGRRLADGDWNGGAGMPTPAGLEMPAGGGIDAPGLVTGPLTVFLPSRALRSILGFLSSDIIAVSPMLD